MAVESRLSTFVAADGDNLAVQDWPLERDQKLRGVVLLVHGLGEHAGRYDHVAQRLNAWGFAVRGYDLYGHGESGGVRGGLPTNDRMLDDLADIMDATRKLLQPGTPLILLGHSMGGLIAARFVELGLRDIDGLVLSSPALAAELNPVQKFLLKVMPRIAPNLRVANSLDVDKLSHDPKVVAAYKADKLVHDRISARLGRFIFDSGASVIAHASTWKVPTLLMYAGQDRLVAPAGSRAFAQAAPKSALTVRCFDDLYHEIFNELDATAVFDTLRNWLDARF
jgi:alpha-beta hydrolase superfamily lysophospholipase